MEEVKINIIKFLTEYGIQLVGALITIIIGVLVARWLGKLLRRWLERKSLEPPLRMLIVRITTLVIIGFAAVLALSKLGVEIGPFIAGIGVVGVGISLAMQGVLGNLVAGLTIIFTKPFRVGEYVELAGVEGQVAQVDLFSTTLTHPDRSRLVVPNRKIVGEILHNYGTMRQLDLTVGVAYSTNIPETITVVRGLLEQNSRVLKEPTPIIGVTTLADSAINISVKPWVAVPDYGAAQVEIYQAIIDNFRSREIQMPFPQREVRLLNGAGAPAVAAK